MSPFTPLRSLRLLAPFVLLILAGCGGSDHGGGGGSATLLAFEASSDFSGTAAPIEDPEVSAADAGGKTTVTIEADGRTLDVTLPSTLAPGSFDLAASGGASATYSEAPAVPGLEKPRGSGPAGTWKTDAGTLTIAKTGTSTYSITLTNAHFTVDGTLQGNPATGEFTMTGTAYGVPYTIAVGPGGSGAFTVTANTSGINPAFTPNYYLKSVTNGLVAAGAAHIEGQVTTNFISVLAQDESSTQMIGTMVNSVVNVSAGSGGGLKTWTATGGQIEVVKTGTKHKFILKDVVYTATTSSGAIGGFTLNGSFEK